MSSDNAYDAAHALGEKATELLDELIKIKKECHHLRLDRDRFEAAAKQALKSYDKEVTEFHRVTDQKNHAYWERNQVVAALSKLFPATLERHQGAGWEDDWRWLVMIILPTGQVSWHIHDSELDFFSHLERQKMVAWDGHTAAEKYIRLQMLNPLPVLSAGDKTKKWNGDLQCSLERRHAGLAYPRTCQTCGLGRCKFGHS